MDRQDIIIALCGVGMWVVGILGMALGLVAVWKLVTGCPPPLVHPPLSTRGEYKECQIVIRRDNAPYSQGAYG